MELNRKKVAISGGSSGIGKAAAILLVRQGCDVALLARGLDKLEEAAAEVRAAAPQQKVVVVSVDVTDDASVASACARVLEELGGLDLLVANQGYARCAPVWEASMDDFHAIMETNFFGHVRLVKGFAAHFKAQRSGAICLVTSMLGFMAFHGYGAYAASKFAISGFAEAIRQEFLPFGVSVHVFFPPTTDTPGLVAENETKPPVTWAIEGTSRQFTSEQVAAAMLDGVRRGRFTQLAGADSWAIFTLFRWVPRLVRWVIDQELWKHVRKSGVPG